MNLKIEKVCFVIDSPMNAMVASLIARDASQVEVIYAFDSKRKDLDEYLRVSRVLLSGLKLHSEQVVEFDSARFWGGEKNDLLLAASQVLAPLIEPHARGTVYFGNCLTNPIALALKYFVKVNHLYHAPGDFTNILFPVDGKTTRIFKRIIKKFLGIPLYEIEKSDYPLFSLIDIPAVHNNICLDFMSFSFLEIEKLLAPLIEVVNCEGSSIMLLLSGDDTVEPGDKNCLNIEKYIKAHSDAVARFIRENSINNPHIWLKEHKSYLPLSARERDALLREFASLGCKASFISDYLPHDYRLIPAECILRYCPFVGVLSESSATLFHSAKAKIQSVAIVSFFNEFRATDEINRTLEYLRLNKLVENKFEVY